MSLEHRLAVAFLTERPAQAALVMEQLPLEARVAVLQAAPAAAARTIREMAMPAAADALALLSPEGAAAALGDLPMDVTVALVRRMPPELVAGITARLSPDRQHALQGALRYPEGTAGALMDPAVLAMPDDITTADARVRLRHESRDLLHYLYIVDRRQRLVGVLGVPELMRARGRIAIRAAMHQDVERLQTRTPVAAIRTHPAWRSFHAMPVVDEEDRLVGAVRYQTLRRLEREAEARRAEPPANVTIAAMGELFHLGIAGFVEGVTAVSAPRAHADARLGAPAQVPGETL